MNRFPLSRSLRPGFCAAIVLVAASLAQAQYTEVPATVAPGRFLVEADALSLVVDREGPEKYTAVGAGVLFVTTGLTSTWDLQVGAELFISQRYESNNFTDRRSGVGDLYVRTKWRFHESDWASIAILPYAKIPTNSGSVGNDSIEGGVIVPWETYVLDGFLTINSMLDVSFIRNVNDDGYETLFYFSSAATKQFTRFLSVYAELDATKSRSYYPWQTTLGVGAYLTISDNLSWDFAMYRGLNRNAPDWNPVIRVNYGF